MSDRQRRYDRLVNMVEVPMFFLAVLLIPVILMPLVEELSPEGERALGWLGGAIWGAFALEYITMLALSPNRLHTFRTRKLDLALVVLPFLRPLRLAQLTRLAHASTALARAAVALRRLLGRPGLSTIFATVGTLIVVGGGLVTIAEHDQPGSTIADFGDGLWWAFVTCTTVGYGDTFPVTGSGRVIASLLMLAGISGLSVITANVAAYFVASDAEDEVDDLAERLSRIEQHLETLNKQLAVAQPAQTVDLRSDPSTSGSGAELDPAKDSERSSSSSQLSAGP